MEIVIICAIGVGGATVVGALLGFIMRGAAERYSGTIMSFAAGIMLAAAISGLIEPSLEGATPLGVVLSMLGIFSGAMLLYFTERFIPMGGWSRGGVRSAILFSVAIAIHNLPEGMIVIVPMLSAGVSPVKTLIFAMAGGVAEVIAPL